MVTYKHITEVVRNRCLNHEAKRVDSNVILLLSATYVGALISWITKHKISLSSSVNKNNQRDKVHIAPISIVLYISNLFYIVIFETQL